MGANEDCSEKASGRTLKIEYYANLSKMLGRVGEKPHATQNPVAKTPLPLSEDLAVQG